MKAHTTWQEVLFHVAPYPPLSTSARADVCIIGGGITGITSAYMLAKAGKKVIVIDKGTLNESVTAYTTAFFTSMIDTALTDCKKMFGIDNLRLVLESHEAAVDTIEAIVKKNQ